MIDRQALRREFDVLQAAIGRRGEAVIGEGSAWARVAELDARQRELKTESEGLQAERNRVSKLIGQKKGKGEDASAELAAMGEVSRRSKELDTLAKEAETEFAAALLEIPNPLHDSVPDGTSEEDNVELRRWGTPRTDEVPPHWDIGTDLGILDFEAGATLAGSRFTVIKGAAARMERALMQFMLDLHADKHGYEEVWVPAIANSKTMTGTGQLPKFADDLYKLEGEDAYLIPTAEVPVTNLYQDKILDVSELPKRHCAYTPCFRREAGSPAGTSAVLSASISSIRWSWCISPRRNVLCPIWMNWSAMPKRYWKRSNCHIAPCSYALPMSVSPHSSPSIWKCGCRARTAIARFHPAHRSASFRGEEPESVTAKRGLSRNRLQP